LLFGVELNALEGELPLQPQQQLHIQLSRLLLCGSQRTAPQLGTN
jgi:hypothetical protein